jgi:trans-2,3-dihydro-3-hydroxyanthranilate isomerase
MPRHRFRLLNVFAESPLSGNALCVFEDGRGLSDEQMQGLALQFNLSETTFLLPSSVATSRVRIFTPTFEMPFAGHPTLGSAHVVRSLQSAGDAVTLDTQAGVIPVTAAGDIWTLQAKAPTTRPAHVSLPHVAAMLGIDERDVDTGVMWVDTGSDQLIVPLRSREAVDRCRPRPERLARDASNSRGDGLAYVWARESETEIVARFFFLKHGCVVEDPGTGSACANLGGWLIATRSPLPVVLTIRQGEHAGRRCRLGLQVDADKAIFVTGRVIEIGNGDVNLS